MKAVVKVMLVTMLFLTPLWSAQGQGQARAQVQSQRQAPLRVGVLVRPDTVTVGDPFVVTITVEVPTSSTVQWPVIGDSAATVAMHAPTRVTKTASSTGADTRQETAEYTLAAWNVGDLPVGLSDVLVRSASDVRAVPLNEARVFVATVLPGDTTLRVPKPARALFPVVIPWWESWWPAALVVALLIALWWLRRRWKAQRLAYQPPVPLDVYERAIQDFARVQRMALVDFGECSRAVALSIEVLRSYLAARASVADLSLTSHEVIEAVRTDSRVPVERLSSLLLDSDVIKFGRPSIAATHAVAVHAEARSLVDAIEVAEQARRQAERAARDAARKSEEDAKRREEDHARRKSRRPKAGAA